MEITLLTYGSRGDVQPFLALALGLQKAGHRVKLAGPHRFADFVLRYQIPFTPLAGEPEIISERLNEAGMNPFRLVSSIRDYVFDIAPQVSRSAFAACEGAELLIHSFLFTVGGHSWAHERGIPDVSVQTFPMFAPTRAFPNVAAGQLSPGLLSYLSHWFAAQAFWFGGNSGYKPARRTNPDIPYPSRLYWPFEDTVDHPRTPLLFAYSPSVLPRPREWGEHIHITGYFFLDEEGYQPPAGLANFLAAGAPPVCISFGSMVNRAAERVTRAALEALARTANRAIFLTGWGGWRPGIIPEKALFIDAAPHGWLFPRCRAVVHHGGAGTTAAGLRAGVPNIVVPHAADQPFWGRRVQAMRAGPAPIPVKKLTAERLIAALVAADAEAIRNGARAAGRMIRAEDGVGQAVRLIEQHAEKWQRSPQSPTF
jgi:sterol 3beta-glucosyltransferase